jgi:membrane protease YdiL (CAAX protease family)
VLGLVIAFAPQVLLVLLALAIGAENTTAEEVTTGTAVFILVTSLVLYGWQTLSAWLFSLRGREIGPRAWGFVRPTIAFFWTIPVAVAATYAVTIVNDVLLDPPQQDIVDQFPRSPGGGVLFFVLAVLFAPLFEELFFRGFLYKAFRTSWGWLPGALTSGAVFALAHMQLTLFVPLLALGVALAWVYERTGSLWTSITMHALFNGVAVLAWSLTS